MSGPPGTSPSRPWRGRSAAHSQAWAGRRWRCYVSGQLLTEDYYVANKLVKGYFGTPNIDTNSRLCMASAVAGHKRAFGEDVVPVSYDDLEASRSRRARGFEHRVVLTPSCGSACWLPERAGRT